ncbi:MAG: YggU family protein [Magnetococcales bacterium]|nr:YggU family protein [Magnetococcales bacterium]
MPPWCHWQGEALLLAIHVQPRAARAQIVGPYRDRLKIALTAPPVEGAANQALCQLLAKHLRVASGQVQVVQGARSRDKTVRINHPLADNVADFINKIS